MSYRIHTRPLSLFAAATVLFLVAGGCRKQTTPSDTASSVMPSTPEARKAAKIPYTTPPAVKKNLYPPIPEGPDDVKNAIAEAGREHKRVILDFGGDWCGDCQVLDIYFHQSPNAELLAKNFIKVNVNVGPEHADQRSNLELANQYSLPILGVPALAVLDEHGKLLYAQKEEFSDIRYMEPQSVTDFLNKWKPGA